MIPLIDGECYKQSKAPSMDGIIPPDSGSFLIQFSAKGRMVSVGETGEKGLKRYHKSLMPYRRSGKRADCRRVAGNPLLITARGYLSPRLEMFPEPRMLCVTVALP